MPAQIGLARKALAILAGSMVLLAWVAVAWVTAFAGTFAGKPALKKIPPSLFRKLVGALVLLLGLYMFTRA